MRRKNLDGCNKIPFNSKKQAKLNLKNGRWKKSKVIYKCKICGLFHHTSKKKDKRFKARLKRIAAAEIQAALEEQYE